MAATAQPVKVGLLGGDDALLLTCAEALGNHGEVVALTLQDDELKWAPVQILLVSVPAPLDKGIAFFARCCERDPRKAVIAMGRELEADIAVELVKCGADDFVSMPIQPDALVRKIHRALNIASPGPAFSWPALEPLALLGGRKPYRGANRRWCFRAKPSGDFRARVTTQVGKKQFTLDIDDISIVTEGWPGGILLRVDRQEGEELPFEQWEHGRAATMLIHLPTGASVKVVARVVPGTRRQSVKTTRFAVQYTTDIPSDVNLLQAFWTECQRRERSLP